MVLILFQKPLDVSEVSVLSAVVVELARSLGDMVGTKVSAEPPVDITEGTSVSFVDDITEGTSVSLMDGLGDGLAVSFVVFA